MNSFPLMSYYYFTIPHFNLFSSLECPAVSVPLDKSTCQADSRETQLKGRYFGLITFKPILVDRPMVVHRESMFSRWIFFRNLCSLYKKLLDTILPVHIQPTPYRSTDFQALSTFQNL